MIYNATLLRVDTLAPAQMTGREIFVDGPSIRHRCTITPTFAQQRVLGATIKDATAVVYIEGVAVGLDSQLSVQADGEGSARLWRIVSFPFRAGGLPHVQAFVREVTE